jgi:hypothetical protein
MCPSVSDRTRVRNDSLPQLQNALYRSNPLFNALQCHNHQVEMFESDRCLLNIELLLPF